MYKSKQEFIAVSQKMQKKIESTQENIEQYITQYGKKRNVRIAIFDSDINIQAISYYQREKKENIPIKKIKELIKEKKNSKYICAIYQQKKSSSSKMFFLSETNGGYILFTKNTKGVRESAEIANEFYLIIGSAVLAAGLLITAVFSKKLSNSIIQMSNVTKKMAELHFEETLPEKGKDEIAELAHNINHMSEKLHDSITMLEKELQSRKQLIRDLSHELKTPIAVVKGYADGLRYGVAEDSISKEKYCKIISSECDRMDKMVKELLELSKLEQVTTALKIETIPLYETISALSVKYTKNIEQKACQFSILGEKSVIVMADKKLLERIIDNLLGNAVKYVNTHGKIEILITESQTETTFSVFNTGTSIPEEHIDKVWNVFYKLDTSRKREQDSHGIGLSIVLSAVRLHHGTVFCQNQHDGVVFGCSLPKNISCHKTKPKTSL